MGCGMERRRLIMTNYINPNSIVLPEKTKCISKGEIVDLLNDEWDRCGDDGVPTSVIFRAQADRILAKIGGEK